MDIEVQSGTPKANIFTFRSVTGAILLFLLACVFFYSAYSKIYSDNAFDNFQWTFIDLGISSQLAAGIIARLMIGLEVSLGLLLLAHIYLKQFTYKAVLLLLAAFTVYLLVVIFKQGNTGNCGCFGDKLAMKPLAAIIKNLVMMAVTVLLIYIYPVKPYKFQEYFMMPIAMLGLTIPFLINNIDVSTAPVPYKKAIDLSLLYKYSPAPQVDLAKGKHIIAFMSLTCPHCKKAAYLLQIIHREHPELPVFMVLDGADTFKKSFFEETHAEQVPHLLYYHTDDFVKMAGMDGVPAIYWINNSNIEYKSKNAYYQLDPKFMEQWVSGK